MRTTSGRLPAGFLQPATHLSASNPGVARGARKTSALLDSGAEESFLDATVSAQWGVPLVEVSKPLVASSLNGQQLGHITQATRPLKMRLSGNHQEEISLLIINIPHSPVVLGHPWMAKHRPHVDWARHEWDPSCSSRCL